LKVKAFVVPEINYGQMVLEVERHVAGKARVELVPHGGGSVHNPKDIFNVIKNSLKG
ncbi:MAG: 2-oxoacid:acceptor oxidoreductase subunit alpha, partial [Ignavibacteriales bacterium]|nr:2-oxoacid:acceptor oxidoreductase subunit alpha [Ignavibacteriales bacterium]